MPERARRPAAAPDWARLARPQADGYDTEVICRLSGHAGRLDPAAPVWFEVSPVYAGRTDFQQDFQGFPDADASHPSLPLAVALVDCWPLGSAQARRLIRVLHASLEPGIAGWGWQVVQSSSHSYADDFGSLWATVNSPVGLAEALVHELAHHKLRALGVGFEHADRLVANRPGERYPSPLLGGRPRPMPALLHAHYALLHMLALELEVLAAGVPQARTVVTALLRRHVELLHAGAALLRRELVVDAAGARFVPSLRSWQASLLARSEVYR